MVQRILPETRLAALARARRRSGRPARRRSRTVETIWSKADKSGSWRVMSWCGFGSVMLPKDLTAADPPLPARHRGLLLRGGYATLRRRFGGCVTTPPHQLLAA